MDWGEVGWEKVGWGQAHMLMMLMCLLMFVTPCESGEKVRMRRGGREKCARERERERER